MIPTKWKLKVTSENRKLINNWRNTLKSDFIKKEIRHDYVVQDGYGLNETHSYTYPEITTDQFKYHVLGLLPNKWCVKASNNPEENIELVEYANRYGERPMYYTTISGIYYHFPCYKGSYTTCLNIVNDYTEITLDDFKKLVLKKQNMKQEIKCPIINGRPHHLKAFVEDCKEFGYRTSDLCLVTENSDRIKLNGNDYKRILSEPDNFEIIVAVNKAKQVNYNFENSITFNLPQDWEEALDLMKFNMKIWKDLNEFKVGDIVHGTIGVLNYVGVYSAPNKMSSWKIIGSNFGICEGNGSFNTIRRATPEEVEFFQNKAKIFKMTSSSGDFELEVSKSGIYYRKDDVYLDLKNGFVDLIDDFDYYLLHNKGRYTTKITKIDVGCKKDTLISEWQEVYNYYKSIQ